MTGLIRPKLLDVGCGSGYYEQVLAHLLPQPIQYIGLDLSEPMISLAQIHQPHLLLLTGDATSLPFGDNMFDIVFNPHFPDRLWRW